MRVLLTGASGQLGRHLRASAPDSVCLLTSSRSGGDYPCDLSDFDAVDELLEAARADVVLNAAAWTAVDKAEDEASAAHRMNADLPARLAAWCRNQDATLVSYSTDYVFSGTGGRAWREEDATAPESVYGQSKLDGERLVVAAGARALIIRTAWVYSALPGNFLRAILDRAGRGQELRVVSDQIGSPTWAGELARATWVLLARAPLAFGRAGCVHVACQGAWSWYDFARDAIRRAHQIGLIERPVGVMPISSDEWPQKARRPAWSVLDGSRYHDWTGDRLDSVENGLQACLEQWSNPPC